ncbi:jg23515, partial [Pararge aegeria aegeria]
VWTLFDSQTSVQPLGNRSQKRKQSDKSNSSGGGGQSKSCRLCRRRDPADVQDLRQWEVVGNLRRRSINGGYAQLLQITSEGCGHCSTVKPAYSRLATALKNENSPIKAIAVEAADNQKVADFAGVETLPTFKIYANGKLLATYEGDRSMEDMQSFCKSHLKVKDEL